MRGVSKLLPVAGLLVLGVFAASSNTAGAETRGLTLSPATLAISLPAGKQEKSAEFTLKNQYQSPLTLRFAFEPRIGDSGKTNPGQYLRISQTVLELAAGQSVHQTITLANTAQLGPGSQLADLVITQINTPGANIGVLPSIRMPLVLIKEDGAVSAISLQRLVAPRFSFTMPGSMSVSLHNSGNMNAIPRGFISVAAPNGTVVRRGVLNTASQAFAPNTDLSLAVPLTNLGNAFWPGFYRTTVSFGFGEGRTPTTASARFFYVAWWHVAVLAVLAAAILYGSKRLILLRHKKPPAHHRPKKVLLIGRHIS